MTESLGEMWYKALEGLPDLPSDGEGPPQMESTKKDEPIKDGESPVTLQKIVTEVYVYTSLKEGDMWYGSKSFQDVQVLGNMRLAEAQQIIDSRKIRKRK